MGEGGGGLRTLAGCRTGGRTRPAALGTAVHGCCCCCLLGQACVTLGTAPPPSRLMPRRLSRALPAAGQRRQAQRPRVSALLLGQGGRGRQGVGAGLCNCIPGRADGGGLTSHLLLPCMALLPLLGWGGGLPGSGFFEAKVAGHGRVIRLSVTITQRGRTKADEWANGRSNPGVPGSKTLAPAVPTLTPCIPPAPRRTPRLPRAAHTHTHKSQSPGPTLAHSTTPGPPCTFGSIIHII